MSRQINMREALDAGIGDSPALGPLTDGLTFHLWRSRPGYRKACRGLRRSNARLVQKLAGNACLVQLVSEVYWRNLRELFARVDEEIQAGCSDQRYATPEEMEEGLRSGRLAIVGAEVSPVPCSSPEEEAAARAGRRMAVILRLEEWLLDPEAVADIMGFDCATGPDETVVTIPPDAEGEGNEGK